VYQEILDLAAAGALRPVVDSTLPFADIVEAYRRVDGGHKAGSLVLTFAA
jgi:NADPH:quinone reductase-like Zn-dependent oxidoreductase